MKYPICNYSICDHPQKPKEPPKFDTKKIEFNKEALRKSFGKEVKEKLPDLFPLK